MAKVIVRIEPETRAALDAIVDTHQWQVRHIQQGLREAKAGRFVSKAGVNKVIARLRRK